MTRLTSRSRFFRLAGALAGLALASGCSDSPTQPVIGERPPAARMGQLGVYAQSNALAPSGTLVVQVSGPGIVKADGNSPDTLAFNIPLSNGVASGSITVPAGPQRVITVRAYDGLTETHRGSVVTDIYVGANPTVSVTLVPLVGDVTVNVSIGTTIVIVRPGVATLGVGDTLRMSAEVRDMNGGLVSGRVRWATLNPGRASVDTLGLVTMRDTGDVQVVATYGTVGGAARLTGTPQTSAIAYQLTWNGSVNHDWTEPNNWTPHGIGAARAPSPSDSVVIPAGPLNQPMIQSCGDQAVGDLIVQAGASIGSTCGYGLNVYRRAVVAGSLTMRVIARPGVSLAGAFDYLNVAGDTVSMADSVRANTVEVNGTNAGLLLHGHRLKVANALNVYNGTVTMADGDTVEASGTINWQGSDQTGRLTGGVLLFHGTDFYGYRYRASGTNRVVFDRAVAGQQSISGFDYYSAPARAGLQHWEVRNRDGVRLCGHVQVADTLTITTTGASSSFDNTSCGGYYLRADGPIVSASNVSITTYLVELHHPTGTSLVAGPWNTTYTDVWTAGAALKPGLAYQNLRLYASATLSGPMTMSGNLEVDGSSTELVLGGQHVSVGGYLIMRNDAVLTMTNPADTLAVSLEADFNGNTRVIEQTHLTAGLLQVGGLLNGSGFNAGGTHLVRMTGTASGTLYMGGQNYQSYDQGFQNLELASGATIGNCNHLRVRGTLTLRAGSTLQEYCGGYTLRVDGDLVTEPGSTFKPYNVELRNPTGTQNVAGTFTPPNTSVYIPLSSGQLRTGLGYTNIGIYAPVTLASNLSVNGDLTVATPAASLALAGHRLDVAGRLNVNDNAILSMTAAGDSVVVAGAASWSGAGNHNGKLTAGVLILRGDSFCPSSFYATGTHLTVFDRTGAPVRVDCVSNGTPANTPLSQVEIRNYGVLLSCALYASGSIHVVSGARVEQNCSNGNLWSQGTLVTDAGSLIGNGGGYPGSNQLGVVLYDSSGTANVSGTYAAHWTYFVGLHAAIKPGLGYHNVRVDRSTTLPDSVTFNGDLNIINDGTILALGGHRLTVRNSMEFANSSLVRMDNPLDTLVVGTGDPTSHLYWNGADNSGLLTNGVVLFDGARFYAPAYHATAPNRFVFTATAAGAPVSVEAAPVFGRMEIRGTRTVLLNDRATVLDTLLISTPTQLLGYTQLVMGGGTGALVTVPGSDVSMPNVYLDGPSGTRAVQGRFRPAHVYFRSASPTADALQPGLEYASMHFEGPYDVLQNMTIGADLTVNTANGLLRFNGHRITMGGAFDAANGARIMMTSPADSLVLGGNFDIEGSAGNSTLSDGVIAAAGDHFYLQKSGSGPSGTNQVILNATGGGYQDLYVTVTEGLRNLYLSGTRTVRINSNLLVAGDMHVTTPITVATNRLQISGSLSTVSGSQLNTAGNLELSDPSGTMQVLGGYHGSATTRFLAGSAGILSRNSSVDSLGYNVMEVAGAATVSGDPLAVKGDLLLSTSSSTLTLPSGSTIGGNVDDYGALTFSGAATGSNYLYVHAGGTASASGYAPVDFTYIYMYGASGPTPAAVLNNLVGSPSTGFRYKSPGGAFYQNSGTVNGQAPSTHP